MENFKGYRAADWIKMVGGSIAVALALWGVACVFLIAGELFLG